jgi:3-deoxy-D-manno-octulosonic-acid transferase
MQYALYNVLLACAAPLARAWLALSPRHGRLRERFSPPTPEGMIGAVWAHACSVGEVNTVRALIPALRSRFPDLPILLTTSTVTGRELALKTVGDTHVTWLPFDTRPAVRRFVGQVRPRVLVLVETEVWPNLVRETRRAGAPVVVVNARLSPRQFPTYRRFRWLIRPSFAMLSAVGAQNEVYAGRYALLGTPADAVHVTGNMKFDAVRTEVDARSRLDLRVGCGYGADSPVLVFGSTRPGDEVLAARCWHILRDRFPELRLVVAPRHGRRLAEAMEPFQGEPVALRSDIKAGRGVRDARVLFVDTMGELVAFYSLATVVVIGGSFFPGVDGHNPLESAALGVATVYGPHMGNFPEASEALLARGGAVQAGDAEALCGILEQLLADPQACRALGTLGRRAVLENRGATDRNADLVAGAVAAQPGK